MTPAECIERYLIDVLHMEAEAAGTFAPDIVSALLEAGFQVGNVHLADDKPTAKEMIEVRNQAVDYAIRIVGEDWPGTGQLLGIASPIAKFIALGESVPTGAGASTNAQIDEGLLPARGQSD